MMIARLRSWWQKTSRPLDMVIVTVLVVLLVLLVLIILGYLFNWPWTGLHGRTLYDWLQLLIIPAVLAVGGYLFNYSTSRNEQNATKLRDQTERDIALDNQREQALQGYIDSMSELLLEKKLRESQPEDEARTIARVRTITILFQLDARRIGYVFAFLREAGLMSTKSNSSIVSFNQADLNKINLSQASIFKANLSGAILSEANLSKTILGEADLSEAYLWKANLSGAILIDADLSDANLSGADLSEAQLWEANLSGANLNRANLSNASLSNASLSRAVFFEAALSGANLSGADLSEVNLSGANLLGAKVTTEQLNKARSLKDATMPDGTKHA